MEDYSCSCNDYNCEHHPSNHKQGCTPCIKKNLAENEIPACFFKLIKQDLSDLESYNLEDFVAFYLKNKET